MVQQIPHLPWLRAFEASARHLSFTRAAEELNLTQAAISKQVKLLEQFLREPLFERRARSLTLTKVGAAYLPKVRDAFERIEAGTNEVFGARRTEVLTIRLPIAFSVAWLMPRLPAFTAAHPDLPLRVLSSVWNDDERQDRYDLDVQYGSGNWPGLRTDRLTQEHLAPLASPALAARLSAPADLADHRLLHVLGYEEGWAIWLKAAEVTGVDPGRSLQFDNSLLAMECAAAGEGVALGRTSMAAPMLASGRLVRPFPLSVPVREGFYLVSPQDGRAHPHAARFRDWLLAEAAAAS